MSVCLYEKYVIIGHNGNNKMDKISQQPEETIFFLCFFKHIFIDELQITFFFHNTI